VISIDTPGLRETTGAAALLMPKAEVSQMVDAMTRIMREPALRRELSERGIEHARTLSWRRCSAETLAVLEEAAHLPAPLKTLAARRANHD
jgi:glycosyltransferase involved in cell wall biosynthesis